MKPLKSGQADGICAQVYKGGNQKPYFGGDKKVMKKRLGKSRRRMDKIDDVNSGLDFSRAED